MKAPVLKVCGARTPYDVELLADAGADLVGLWHGMPGGHAELTVEELADLAGAARATGRLRPMLVTFLADPERLADVLRRTGIRWVQLHAYQPPGVVRATKTAVPDATVVKVLHLRDGACVERRFVGAYQRAGTDLFLLDRVTDDGRVGSTGQRLDPAEVTDLAGELAVPFLLAGGLDAHAADDYHAVTVLPGYAGIDVDGAARTRRGAFDPTAVGAIVRSWGTGARHPLSPRQPLHPEEP